MRIWFCGVLLALIGASSWTQVALGQALRVDRSAERMRVDGSLREWRSARFADLGASSGPSARYALAVADGGLYLGVEVHDEHLARRPTPGSGQDAVVLTIALPDAGDRWVSTDVWLHPGVTGKYKAIGALARGRAAPKANPDIRVVEGPLAQDSAGYVLEAFFPWRLVRGSELWEQGRARLRIEDVDRPGARAAQVIETSPAASPLALPRFALGVGHKDLLGSFLSAQQLAGVEPRFDLRGDVSGDAAPERVVLVDKYVLVYGPGFKRGESYGYYALPFGHGGGVQRARLMDATGDGRKELIVSLRQRNQLGARDLWMVLSLVEDAMRPLFAVELRKEVPGGFIENKLVVQSVRSGPAQIRVELDRASGLDQTRYQETPAHDASPILLPWGPVSSRTFAFDGSTFAVREETPNADASTSSKAKPKDRPVVQARPPTAASASAPSLDEALAREIRKTLGLAQGARPSRQLSANLAGGSARERALAFGGNIVVFGADIAQGRGYLVYRLPLERPDDLQHLGAVDVTGDGRAELFLRVRQDLSGANGAHRELVLVLRVDAQGRLSRVLSAEVTRRQGDRVVANRVRTSGGRLTIEPGHAEGWDAASYPFVSESTGGAERLLLPWGDGPASYRFERDRFVAFEPAPGG